MNPLIISHTATNFSQALEIINLVWEIAERENHHPNIKLHSYKQLEFELFTHDQWKVTEKDELLWKEIENILTQYK